MVMVTQFWVVTHKLKTCGVENVELSVLSDRGATLSLSLPLLTGS